MDIRVFTDATTGKSIATRRGLGKVRHISMNELSIVKIKNTLNPVELLTKHLSKDKFAHIVEALCHGFSEREKSRRARTGDGERDHGFVHDHKPVWRLKLWDGRQSTSLQRGQCHVSEVSQAQQTKPAMFIFEQRSKMNGLWYVIGETR